MSDLIAAGYYFGDIIPGAFGFAVSSGEKKTPYIHVMFSVHSYNNGREVVQFSPIRRTVNIYMTDATLGTPDSPGMARVKLQHMGFNNEFKEKMAFSNGTDIELHCVHEPYTDKNGNSRTSEKWDVALPGGAGLTHVDATDDVIRTIKAKLGPAPKPSLPPPATKPAAPPPAAKTAETVDDARNQCWAAHIKAVPKDWDAQRVAEQWASDIEKKFPGVAETDLTRHEWLLLLADFDIPF